MKSNEFNENLSSIIITPNTTETVHRLLNDTNSLEMAKYYPEWYNNLFNIFWSNIAIVEM